MGQGRSSNGASVPGDGFTLVQMADPLASCRLDAGMLESEPSPKVRIENLELLYTGADVTATLTEVGKLVDTAWPGDSPRAQRNSVEVYFFSDMQARKLDAGPSGCRRKGPTRLAVQRIWLPSRDFMSSISGSRT